MDKTVSPLVLTRPQSSLMITYDGGETAGRQRNEGDDLPPRHLSRVSPFKKEGRLETSQPLVYSCAFGGFFTISSILLNHCYSFYQTESRQHTRISTVSYRNPLRSGLRLESSFQRRFLHAKLKLHDLQTLVNDSSPKYPHIGYK